MFIEIKCTFATYIVVHGQPR